jgi:hypothetical protein
MAEVVDPRFKLERTMGASGPRLQPEGHGPGRICGVCGVLFYPKKEPAAVLVTAEEAAGIMTDAPLPRFEVKGGFPTLDDYRSVVEGQVPRGRLEPQLDGTYRVERKEVTAEEAAGIMTDAPLPRFEVTGGFPVVGGQMPRGRLVPLMDGTYVELDDRPFRQVRRIAVW